MSKHTTVPWLSDDQVFELNEKFGWMQKADAQSDQSRAFIQAAIDKHERIRNAAPDLLTALKSLDKELKDSINIGLTAYEAYDTSLQELLQAAFAKAEGTS